MAKVLIGGITYSGSRHRAHFTSRLKDISGILTGSGIHTETMITTWQPSGENFPIGGVRFNINSWLSHKWFHEGFGSLDGRRFSGFKATRSLILDLLGRGLPRERNNSHYMRRDQILTDKHIRLWIAALEGGFDAVLVVTDDVRETTHHSSEKLILAASKAVESCTMVELAPFYKLPWLEENLGIACLERDNGFVRTGVFGNTCAAYFLGAKACYLLLEFILCKPELRTCSIDWLITYLGRRLENDFGFEYWVSDPPLLDNGSLESGDSDLVLG